MKKIVYLMALIITFQSAHALVRNPEDTGGSGDDRVTEAQIREEERARQAAEKKRQQDKEERTLNAKRELEINAINILAKKYTQIASQVSADLRLGLAESKADTMLVKDELNYGLVYSRTGEMDNAQVDLYEAQMAQKLADSLYALYTSRLNEMKDAQLKALK